MYDELGRVYRPSGHRHHRSSNGMTIYTTTLWSNNFVSCNCPGWTIEKKDKYTKAPLPRTCSHVKKGGPFNDTMHAFPTSAPMASRELVAAQSTGRRIKG